MNKSEAKVFQPYDLFKILDIKEISEAECVFSNLFSFLAYLGVGDRVETSTIVMEKIAPDLIHITNKLKIAEIVNEFSKKKIIKFPI